MFLQGKGGVKTANENTGKFQPGTRFRGNVNGAEMEVVKIEDNNATIKDLKTGRVFIYGLQALEHCDLEVTGWRMRNV